MDIIYNNFYVCGLVDFYNSNIFACVNTTSHKSPVPDRPQLSYNESSYSIYEYEYKNLSNKYLKSM